MRFITIAVSTVLCGLLALPATAKTETLSALPYRGAIVLNAADGQVLFEDKADAIGYPASVLKLMTLLLVLEKVDQGALKLEDRVTVTAEASKMGGSQVYLAEKEVFTIDDLLYALMIQSANDAATALALHVAGSRPAFVQLMNQKAQALGMKNTKFVSEHGLPSADRDPDTTTARDLALLGRELTRHPAVYRYTSMKERGFRNDTFIMRNHNNLLGVVDGVDGFKTGYFRAAGYSIVATAQRDGVRIIAVVLGCTERLARDEKAKELLAAGFLAVPRTPQPAPAPAPAVTPTNKPTAAMVLEDEEAPVDEEEESESSGGGWWKLPLGIVLGVGIALGVNALLRRRSSGDMDDLLRR